MNARNTQHIVCPQCHAVNRITSGRLRDKPQCGKCHKPLFTGQPIDLNAGNFQIHIARNDIPVVVDFWAPWCNPCKLMAPAYEQASAELEPVVRLVKLNTENESAIAARYVIQSIPTIVIFQNGREIARQSGAMSVSGIVGWVRTHISD